MSMLPKGRSLPTFPFLGEGPPVPQGKWQCRSCITAGDQSPPQDTIALVLFPLHFRKINLIGTNPDMASLKANVLISGLATCPATSNDFFPVPRKYVR